MLAVVGLGNPGPEYDGTRHNVGFEVVDRVVHDSAQSFGRGPSRVRGLIAHLGNGSSRVLYFRPSTYMNDSGSAVRSALSYFKIDPESLLVVHDDIDLPFARLRLQVGRGSGGHNGIRSIESALGTREFSRLKFGVGRPPGRMDPADYVLRRFSKTERPEVDLTVAEAADVVSLWAVESDKAQEQAALWGRT